MEELISEILEFTKKFDKDISQFGLLENAAKAKKYLEFLKDLKKENNSTVLEATIKKLEFIIKKIYTVNFYGFWDENILDLVPLSVTDFIINLIRNKYLVDPLLIARYAYIELAKVLYYDISYVKQKDCVSKKKICDAVVNVHKEKIFSYVVCTQWLQLYTYILKQFGIEVSKKNIPGQDHVWGEIKLNDEQIIVVDATDYINSSIDLSNAKSVSPTVGFAVLPKEYSGLKLYDIFSNKNNSEMAKVVNDYYKLNRELDITLKYITEKGYPVERIIEENELFHYPKQIIKDPADIRRFLESIKIFFKKLKIPNNIDGYEIFAYYDMFIRNLPLNIRANVAEETLYVDSFSYKIKKLRKQFLHVPNEYLKYLESLIYSRYYKYLSEDENNAFLEQMRRVILNEEQLKEQIAKNELLIAEINRNISLYYAINKLHFYEPITAETVGIQLYEPMMGIKCFSNTEEFNEFKRTISLK